MLPSSKNLKKVRLRTGLTQEEFATMLGIKRATLGAYEEGRARPNMKVVNAIFEKFRIPTTKMYEFLNNENFVVPVNILTHVRVLVPYSHSIY